MSNVDKCVRLSEEAMTKAKNELYSYAENINNISNNERVTIFKYKDKDKILDILQKMWEHLRVIVVADENFKKFNKNNKLDYQNIKLYKSNNNNKDGADLYTNINGNRIDIELKFGNETNRNIGMENFNKIFDNTFFSCALCSIQRNNWYNQYLTDTDENKQLCRLHTAINDAIENFNNYYQSKNWQLDNRQQEFMENLILKTTGDGTSNTPLIKCILENDNFTNTKTVKTGIGTWFVNKVEKINDSIQRCNIYTNNGSTNVQIKYVLNWKNNYKGCSAKLGFGTPSWNVWVDVVIIEL